MAGTKKQNLKKAKMLRRRKLCVRNRVVGTPERPRLSVHRSLNEIYVQIIDDTRDDAKGITGMTLISASTRDKSVIASFEPEDTKVKKSYKVGLTIAQLAKEKGIECVMFDRQGFLYHGRVKAVADGAREGGLKF